MSVLTFGRLAINSALTTIESISSTLDMLKSAAQALSTSLGFSSFKTSSAPSSAAVAPVQGAAAAASMDLTAPAPKEA